MCENALSHWSHWYGFSPVRIDWFGLNELYSRHQLQYRVQVYISSSLNKYWHFPLWDDVQVWVTIMCKHVWKNFIILDVLIWVFFSMRAFIWGFSVLKWTLIQILIVVSVLWYGPCIFEAEQYRIHCHFTKILN